MLTGTGGAQLIALLFTPVLTRIFSPEAFGHLGIFQSLANLLIPIAALTLPMAIVLSKNTNEALQITKLSLITTVVFVLILGLLIAVNIDFLTSYLNADSSNNYLYWVPLLVLFSGFLQVAVNWITKLSLFTLRAKVIVLHAIIINFLKLLIGYLFPYAATLIFIAILNPLFNALMLFTPIFRRIKPAQAKQNDVVTNNGSQQGNWFVLLKKYRDFPMYQSPQAFFNACSQGVPVLLLAAFFGPVSAGFYTFSRTILAIPISLVSLAIGDVFYSRIAQDINNQQYAKVKKHFFRTTALLALLGFIPLVVSLVWAPDIFAFIFGEQWFQAGVYAQWLAIWTFVIFINVPSLKIIIAYQQQKKSLLINLITLPTRITALFLGGYYLADEQAAIYWFVAISVLHNLVIIGLAHRICAQKVKKMEVVV